MQSKNIFPALLLTLLLSSCGEDFLNKTDPTRLVEGSFYQTETQINQAVNGVFSQLQAIIRNQWQYNEFITDNTTLQRSEERRVGKESVRMCRSRGWQ